MQYFPGRPIVTNLLKDLNSWLQKQTGNRISYEAFKEKLENDAQVSSDRYKLYIIIIIKMNLVHPNYL